MHFDTKKLTRCALIAAIYVALTMLSNALNLAYGPIQLRFSEAMTVLPFLMPEASWGLFIGCVLSNILSPYGPLDMIVGSAATLLAALLTARCRNKWTAALPPVLCNAILIGALIAWEEAKEKNFRFRRAAIIHVIANLTVPSARLLSCGAELWQEQWLFHSIQPFQHNFC